MNKEPNVSGKAAVILSFFIIVIIVGVAVNSNSGKIKKGSVDDRSFIQRCNDSGGHFVHARYSYLCFSKDGQAIAWQNGYDDPHWVEDEKTTE